MPEDESRLVLAQLFEHSVRPEHIYRHCWQPHDLVFWDNRSLMHLAAGTDADERRKMYRTTVEGDTPFSCIFRMNRINQGKFQIQAAILISPFPSNNLIRCLLRYPPFQRRLYTRPISRIGFAAIGDMALLHFQRSVADRTCGIVE
jgi:hypothetical protein